MLNIKFKTDKDIMAKFIISKNLMPITFANYLYDKYKSSYLLLLRNSKSNKIDNNIILELQQQDFFKQYLNEANQNLVRIENNWIKNKDKINEYLSRIFKKNFTIDTTAIIVCPALNTEENLRNNTFVWGYQKGLDDAFYDLIYLVHESLHSYFKNGEITHAIIENIADIGLNKHLENKDVSFNDCHSYIKMLHIKILPFWNIYLEKKKADIEKTNAINNISYDQSAFDKYKSKTKNMNIDDFVTFLEELDLENLINIKCSYSIDLKTSRL